jgi:hypothetical protein
VQQHVDVDDGHLGVVQQVLVLGHHLFFEDLVDLGQQMDIEPGVAVGAQKAHHQRFDGGMGGAVGIGGHTGVDDVHARLDGLEMAHGDMPEVKWLCRWMGGLTAALRALTIS